MNAPKQKADNPPDSAPVSRCLVTGGAGFIGSHTVGQLLAAGHEVAVLDNLSAGKEENVPEGVSLFVVDITGDVSAPFAEFRPEVVVHLAAQTSVPASMADPIYDARTNILGSIELIRSSAEFGVKKIVYASSAAAYGPLDVLPLHEGLSPRPVSPYGASKYTVEHYLRAAFNELDLQWTALRFANVYGPRQDPHGEAGVVAIFAGLLFEGESPTVFDDGEQTRDYVYVEDVARALVHAVERDFSRDGLVDPVFNVSTGVETSVNVLLQEMNRALHTDIAARYAPRRPGDVRRSVLDPTAAKKFLGWEAEVPTAEGLRRTLEFFRQRLDA